MQFRYYRQDECGVTKDVTSEIHDLENLVKKLLGILQRVEGELRIKTKQDEDMGKSHAE